MIKVTMDASEPVRGFIERNWDRFVHARWVYGQDEQGYDHGIAVRDGWLSHWSRNPGVRSRRWCPLRSDDNPATFEDVSQHIPPIGRVTIVLSGYEVAL